MKKIIVCCIAFSFFNVLAMDVSPEESRLQKVYGGDMQWMKGFSLLEVTAGKSNEAIPVSVKFDKFTKTAKIKGENRGEVWRVPDSLVRDIDAKNVDCEGETNWLTVQLREEYGNNIYFLMHKKNLKNERDTFMDPAGYYIKDCMVFDSNMMSSGIQAKVMHDWSHHYVPQLQVEVHPFWIKIISGEQSEESEWLFCSTINRQRREQIVECIRNAQPFVLTVTHLYEDNVEDIKLVINTFCTKPETPKIESKEEPVVIQSPWRTFMVRAGVIIPFCGLAAGLIYYLCFKKGL